MYLNQTPTGFNLGEKSDYKLVSRKSGRGRGGPLVISTHVHFRDLSKVKALMP